MREEIQLDALLKIGGSLSKYPKKLKRLCVEISKLVGIIDIIIVPGGGEFADLVRKHYETFDITQETAHQMAIRAMDQYGLLLADITPNSVMVEYIYEAYDAITQNKVPILLPYSLVKDTHELEASWDVTSDSISLYLAYIIGCKKLILLKDVDGIYGDDELLQTVTTKWLADHPSCIDKYFPKLLSKMYVDTYIVNGLYPDRLLAALQELPAIYTRIIK